MENHTITNPVETTPVNSAPVNQPPVTQVKMNLLVPILSTILLSAVVFGLGGYFLGKQSINLNNTDPQTVSKVKNQQQPTPTSAPLIENIKMDVYSDKNGFSVKFPSEKISYVLNPNISMDSDNKRIEMIAFTPVDLLNDNTTADSWKIYDNSLYIEVLRANSSTIATYTIPVSNRVGPDISYKTFKSIKELADLFYSRFVDSTLWDYVDTTKVSALKSTDSSKLKVSGYEFTDNNERIEFSSTGPVMPKGAHARKYYVIGNGDIALLISYSQSTNVDYEQLVQSLEFK